MAEKSSVGVKEENVLIQAGDCSVTVLPRFGGKISSIKVRGHELLQAPLAPVAPRTRTMTFDEGDASGWDECLPSVAACTVTSEAGSADIPDHGDLWRVEWEKAEIRETANAEGHASVALRGQSFSLPLVLERSLALTEVDGGWRLDIDYRLTNTGPAVVPWSWAAHPLFVAEAGDRLVLPDSIQSLRLEGSGGKRLGS